MSTVINFCTQALGDSIAFSPYADEYQRIYGGHVYVKTKWYTVLKSNNSNVYFFFESFAPEMAYSIKYL